jgi:hypothetical protein
LLASEKIQPTLGREYIHFHRLPNERIEAVYYDGPGAARIIRREILRQGEEDAVPPEFLGSGEYRCETYRNWGNGIEMVVEWTYPLG